MFSTHVSTLKLWDELTTRNCDDYRSKCTSYNSTICLSCLFSLCMQKKKEKKKKEIVDGPLWICKINLKSRWTGESQWWDYSVHLLSTLTIGQVTKEWYYKEFRQMTSNILWNENIRVISYLLLLSNYYFKFRKLSRSWLKPFTTSYLVRNAYD